MDNIYHINSIFTSQRFGINVRLVQEKDAQFILSLRTDEQLSRYIHHTKNDLDFQVKWIKEYKLREQNGEEYYFIYEKDGSPIGINRISNIRNKEGVSGSVICSPRNNPIDTLATIVILYDMAFIFLKLDTVLFATDKNNRHALRINYSLGADVKSENEKEFFFLLKKDNYLQIRDTLIKKWRLIDKND